MATAPAECTFVVKEDRDNRPFIAIEPSVAGSRAATVEHNTGAPAGV
jgi:hypothetical protein